MRFQDYLNHSAKEINREIGKFFISWSREVKTASPKLIGLNKAFIQASEGGKRLRGVLVKLGYELADTKYNPEILKPAAAFEIFQTAILAHDDIIDQSPLRRGKPTVYMQLGGNHYGMSQTICLGDIGYFLAVRLIAQSDFSSERKTKALELFSQAMLETALGQMLDVELPYLEGDKEEADALTVFRLKTARYTLVGPLSLGAILGGADEKLLKSIEMFGESLGIAFQIQDDILGVFGNEQEVGKSITSDIEEGKNTLLLIHALKNGSAKERQVLDQYYGKGKVGDINVKRIREVFVSSGALEYSQKKAEELINDAKDVISKMEIQQNCKEMLLQMADFLVKRSK